MPRVIVEHDNCLGYWTKGEFNSEMNFIMKIDDFVQGGYGGNCSGYMVTVTRHDGVSG